jgi:intein/homing endonuclease
MSISDLEDERIIRKPDESNSNKIIEWSKKHGAYKSTRPSETQEVKVIESANEALPFYQENPGEYFDCWDDDLDTASTYSASEFGCKFIERKRTVTDKESDYVKPGFYRANYIDHELMLEPVDQIAQDEYIDMELGVKELYDDMVNFFEKKEVFDKYNMVRKRSSLLFGPPGTGKCITGDSTMYLENGEPVSAEWVYKNKPEKVLSFDQKDGKIKPSKVNECIDSGLKKTYKVTTRRGYSIKVSKDHPFLTPNGWKNIEANLSEGCFIGVTSNYEYTGTDELSKKEVEYLALMIAEGSLTGSAAKFTSNNEEILKMAESIAESFNNIELVDYGNYDYVFQKINTKPKTNPCIQFLRDVNLFGKKSKGKFIPQVVFGLNKNLIRRFIEVLFSTDGWYETRTNPIFGYASASKELIDGLRHLLLQFGIVPNYRVKETSCEDSHSLILTGKQAWEFFQEFDLIDRKEPDEDEFDVNSFNRNWSNIRLSDNKFDKLAKLTRKENPWGEGESRGELVERLELKTQAKHLCPHRLKNKGLPQEDFEKLSQEYKDGIFDYFWCDSDVVYDEIESIEEVGEEQMYDFEIDNTHSFIANDMVVHNSFSAIHLCKQAIQEYDAIVILTPPKDTDFDSLTSCFRESLQDRTTIFMVEELTEAKGKKEEILSFLDGENSWNNSYAIGTTNYPGKLDKNIVDRPGRFDKVIEVDEPDKQERKKYLESVTNRTYTDKELAMTEGYSFSYLKELVLRMELEDKSLETVIEEFEELKREIDEQFQDREDTIGF